MTIPAVSSCDALRRHVSDWRTEGLGVALVPTMGALHAGHLSLVREALKHTDRVVVSIFVNPTQFGPGEDFESYPRREAEDRERLRAAGAHLAYTPSAGEMYPPAFSTEVHVHDVSEGLCGAARPGHFTGVATVVTKLLLQTLPDVAVFGEKDYQQLMVIRRLVRDLDIPVNIVGAPLMREDDGLALSSRNAYLSPEERRIAPHLYQTLTSVRDAVFSGKPPEIALAEGIDALKSVGFSSVDYLEIRDAESLAPAQPDRPARLLAAVHLGPTRLIDNIAAKLPHGA